MIPVDLLLSFLKNLEESMPATDLPISLSGFPLALFPVFPDFLVPLILSMGPTLLILRAGINAEINTVIILRRITAITAAGLTASTGFRLRTPVPSKLNSFSAMGPAVFAASLTVPRPNAKPIGRAGRSMINASKYTELLFCLPVAPTEESMPRYFALSS